MRFQWTVSKLREVRSRQGFLMLVLVRKVYPVSLELQFGRRVSQNGQE